MSNGIWTAGDSAEKITQSKFVRHRLLVVSPGFAAAPYPADVASGLAALAPDTISPATVNAFTPRGNEGGPHFVMSGETPDESHTYGFEFCLFTDSMPTPALPGVGDYTVTVWVLISNTMDPNGFNTPVWAAMATNTGVAAHQLWHSFDVNAEAVRFQVTNFINDPAVVNESLGIAFAEL